MEKVNLYTYVKDAYFGPSDVCDRPTFTLQLEHKK